MWYSGSQETVTSPGRHCSPSWRMAFEFAIRFPCVTITPLGAEVLPEVNCKKAISWSAGWGGGSMSGTSARSSGVRMTRSSVPTLPTADQSTLPTRSLVTSA